VWRAPSKSAVSVPVSPSVTTTPDVAVEEVLVVVVAQLDDLVARTVLAAERDCAGPGRGVERGLQLGVEVATPATPLCIGASTCTSLMDAAT
jgi:hypothetical protein